MYEIVLNNKKIYDFYQSRNISIESANLLIIDFIETIFNEMNTTNISSQILNFMTENKNQLENLKTSISTIQDNVSKLHSDMMNQIIIQCMNVKKEYLEDVRQIVLHSSLSTNEKITSLVDKNNSYLIEKTSFILKDILPKNQEHANRVLQEHFKEFSTRITEDIYKLNSKDSMTEFIQSFENKYHSMLQSIQQPLFSYFNASEDRIQKNIETLKENNTISMTTQSKVFDELNDFLNKYKGSSNKGKYGEQNLFGLLNIIYPNAEIKNTTE